MELNYKIEVTGQSTIQLVGTGDGHTDDGKCQCYGCHPKRYMCFKLLNLHKSPRG